MLAAAPLALLALSACASPFSANVKRFQAELPTPSGQTFAVVADDPALSGGLEFSQYAALVDAQMAKLGYAKAADPAQAQLVVRFDYGVDKGRQQVTATGFRADPFWNPWFGYSYGYTRPWGRPYRVGPHGGWGYGWYDPWFTSDIDVSTIYTSGVSLKIDRKDDGKRLFEGKAEAASTSNRLQYLVPNLVESMFTDFTGHNGETVRITVAPEKQGTK